MLRPVFLVGLSAGAVPGLPHYVAVEDPQQRPSQQQSSFVNRSRDWEHGERCQPAKRTREPLVAYKLSCCSECPGDECTRRPHAVESRSGHRSGNNRVDANLEAARMALAAAGADPWIEGPMGQLKAHPGFAVARAAEGRARHLGKRCGTEGGRDEHESAAHG